MTLKILELEHMATDVWFYHQSDERAYFEWLQRIPCVATFNGEGIRGLVVRLKRRPGKDDLHQFLALAWRYGLDMQQFAKFETSKNANWFRNPEAYWYQAVFGKVRRRRLLSRSTRLWRKQ